MPLTSLKCVINPPTPPQPVHPTHTPPGTSPGSPPSTSSSRPKRPPATSARRSRGRGTDRCLCADAAPSPSRRGASWRSSWSSCEPGTADIAHGGEGLVGADVGHADSVANGGTLPRTTCRGRRSKTRVAGWGGHRPGSYCGGVMSRNVPIRFP